MSGRNRQISNYAREMLDTSFLMTFFFWCFNNHFYHIGKLDKSAYDNIVAMIIVMSITSLIIRWTVVRVWRFRRLPVKQYIGLLETIAALGLLLFMYQYSLVDETVYRLFSQTGYCLIIFGLTSAKVRNA